MPKAGEEQPKERIVAQWAEVERLLESARMTYEEMAVASGYTADSIRKLKYQPASDAMMKSLREAAAKRSGQYLPSATSLRANEQNLLDRLRALPPDKQDQVIEHFQGVVETIAPAKPKKAIIAAGVIPNLSKGGDASASEALRGAVRGLKSKRKVASTSGRASEPAPGARPSPTRTPSPQVQAPKKPTV